MRVIKLAESALGDTVLSDTDLASFLARRLSGDTILDFGGIEGVSDSFLELLLADFPPESLQSRVLNSCDAVQIGLARWRNRKQADRTGSSQGSSPHELGQTPNSEASAPVGQAPEPETWYTPTRLVERLRNTLQGYIESAYPLNDACLVRARRRLFEEADAGRLLAQEPFVEATPSYPTSNEGYSGIGLPAHLQSLLERLSRSPLHPEENESRETLLFPTPYVHQRQALRSFLSDGKECVVGTGTGSGKTECFLLPMMCQLYDEACHRPGSWSRRAVRALVLYPMNALVNDQLARIRLLLGSQAVKEVFRDAPGGRIPLFGKYTSRTPYPGPRSAQKDGEYVQPLLNYYLKMDPAISQKLRHRGRLPVKDLTAFLAEHLAIPTLQRGGSRAGLPRTKHQWEKRLQTHPDDSELLTRHEMIHGVGCRPAGAPDVLITNYSMLEYMLMRPFERSIFDETVVWLREEGNSLLLVLDEAHMYRGAKGAEVAFLIRRLQARLGIHDSPEKLRVIATSATLGSDAAAQESIRRFAADLTGKEPGDFVTVTARREIPSPAAPGDESLARMLASIDMRQLHEAHEASQLTTALAPVFSYFGQSVETHDAAGILASLYAALKGQPYLNLLVQAAAGNAIPLRSLADKLFPGIGQRVAATQALLALGALARPKPDTTALVPARIHAMFRGLTGLYACINPECPGRQDRPGARAPVGRLFAESRQYCDCCGSRVLELASCRSCGAPYLLGYSNGSLERFDYIWGEADDRLSLVQFLTVEPKPQNRQHTTEVPVVMATGMVDRQLRTPPGARRHLFMAVDSNGMVLAEFPRCPLCQRAPSKARISTFRTRGEQPFTALVETQFSEQAPQNPDPTLFNRGRKVLIFSDGRQKAARLAPALEHSHGRDLFRQVLVLAAEALQKARPEPTLEMLYPTLVWLCANGNYKVTPVFDDDEMRRQMSNLAGQDLNEALHRFCNGWLKPTQHYGQALFEEMTDRFYSLPALALGRIEVAAQVARHFPAAPGVPPDQVGELLACWVRLQLEARRFIPSGTVFDPFGNAQESPTDLDPTKPKELFPGEFQTFASTVQRRAGASADVVEMQGWLAELVRNSRLFFKQNDRYYLSTESLVLRPELDEAALVCRDCGRLYGHTLHDLCPACAGPVEAADPQYLDARRGFYRSQLVRAMDQYSLEPFGLLAAEHSAQLTGGFSDEPLAKTEAYELRFQDLRIDGADPIDVLSCTTTMEVGIDIGALAGVALRNVPPHVANYQQRAGRAGRRGRSVASVITYAHENSHDAHCFAEPGSIISGNVRPPVVYIENQEVLGRHINAYVLQRFFHENLPSDSAAKEFRLHEALGDVRSFLTPSAPTSMAKLETWLKKNERQLRSELRSWVPKWSHCLAEPIPESDVTISSSSERLLAALAKALPMAAHGSNTGVVSSSGDEATSLPTDLEEQLDAKLLERLNEQAVIPRYAFPLDVVSFWVMKPPRKGTASGRREYDYQPQRDLQLALSDYAPGRSLTIDKFRFLSAAVYSPTAPRTCDLIAEAKPYVACYSCNYVSFSPILSNTCPICQELSLQETRFIVPPGFAADVNARREYDDGQAPTFAGETERAQLEMQDPPSQWMGNLFSERLRSWSGPSRLVMVNKGNFGDGFRICPDCGRVEPVTAPFNVPSTLVKKGKPVIHNHPTKYGHRCDGHAQSPFYLGHSFPTDVLLLRLKVEPPVMLGHPSNPARLSTASMSAMTTLVEAISLAASRELQIEEGELSGWWMPLSKGDGCEAQLYLYDLLPGGAGYAKDVGRNLPAVLATTRQLLAQCACESACYRCLQHYGNHRLHANLDRHLALDLLDHMLDGKVPRLDQAAELATLAPLRSYLSTLGISNQLGEGFGHSHCSLLVRHHGYSHRVMVHHPLVPPTPVPLTPNGLVQPEQVHHVSSVSLLRRLPEVVARLGL